MVYDYEEPRTPGGPDVVNINGGTLRKDDNQVIATGIHNKWFKIRVEHTAVAGGRGSVKVFRNGSLKLTHPTRARRRGTSRTASATTAVAARRPVPFRNITYWRQ